MFRVVIPARMGSQRLPGKPLKVLAGRPMVQWSFDRARRSGASSVLVATDDERIARAVREVGGEAAMTAPTHASGTDRIAEIARREGWDEGDVIVNLQADEPLMPPQLLDQVAALFDAHPNADLTTLAVPIDSVEALLDTHVVKVVADRHQRALYFSRAPIPWSRDSAPDGLLSQRNTGDARRHLGIYGYRVGALLRLAALPPSPLEQLEKLEQLRALENGMDIRVAQACAVPGPDVNTEADLTLVAALLQSGG